MKNLIPNINNAYSNSKINTLIKSNFRVIETIVTIFLCCLILPYLTIKSKLLGVYDYNDTIYIISLLTVLILFLIYFYCIVNIGAKKILAKKNITYNKKFFSHWYSDDVKLYELNEFYKKLMKEEVLCNSNSKNIKLISSYISYYKNILQQEKGLDTNNIWSVIQFILQLSITLSITYLTILISLSTLSNNDYPSLEINQITPYIKDILISGFIIILGIIFILKMILFFIDLHLFSSQKQKNINTLNLLEELKMNLILNSKKKTFFEKLL